MGLANNSIYSPSIILLICILGPVFMVCTRLGQYLFKIAPTEWFKSDCILFINYVGCGPINYMISHGPYFATKLHIAVVWYGSVNICKGLNVHRSL